MFLRTLGQVVYGFKAEILDILDQPLVVHLSWAVGLREDDVLLLPAPCTAIKIVDVELPVPVPHQSQASAHRT